MTWADYVAKFFQGFAIVGNIAVYLMGDLTHRRILAMREEGRIKFRDDNYKSKIESHRNTGFINLCIIALMTCVLIF